MLLTRYNWLELMVAYVNQSLRLLLPCPLIVNSRQNADRVACTPLIGSKFHFYSSPIQRCRLARIDLRGGLTRGLSTEVIHNDIASEATWDIPNSPRTVIRSKIHSRLATIQIGDTGIASERCQWAVALHVRPKLEPSSDPMRALRQ